MVYATLIDRRKGCWVCIFGAKELTHCTAPFSLCFFLLIKGYRLHLGLKRKGLCLGGAQRTAVG